MSPIINHYPATSFAMFVMAVTENVTLHMFCYTVQVKKKVTCHVETTQESCLLNLNLLFNIWATIPRNKGGN